MDYSKPPDPTQGLADEETFQLPRNYVREITVADAIRYLQEFPPTAVLVGDDGNGRQMMGLGYFEPIKQWGNTIIPLRDPREAQLVSLHFWG